jgi:Na+/H+-dicarboxylate symporter
MLLVLMLTSKGIAGVPRASLVVVAATCGMFDIPIEGIALILPIDHFCDMFSATNVWECISHFGGRTVGRKQ